MVCFAAFLMLILTGCSDTILYNTTQPPLNLTSKSGEIYGSANIGGTGQNFTVGFAPGQHLQVAASYGNKEVDSYSEKSTYKAQEYMIGYFNEFETGMVFEGFFGVGMGTTATTIQSSALFSLSVDTVKHTGEYNKQFMQINIGRKNGFFESGISVRCSNLKYRNVQKTRNHKIEYKGSPEGLLWEPVVFGKVGTDNFKVMITTGWAYIPGVKEISYTSMFINAGAVIKFSVL